MPIYPYRCAACGATREVLHPMDECAGPFRTATLDQIRCTAGHASALMSRQLADTFAIGTGLTGAGLDKRRAQVKARSRADYEKNISERKQAVMREPERQI